ncbi:hypothetical protein K491DRAFT_264758 [Lophiostoma macrostomum CBS 122681]|uniref:FAD-binding PCMH-type domain-containing protein n=1 Tax=Lophiostoma macrostomum CBS 122681 TaxID=1314788 RepID=A0A6A6SK89_9PLEO|nr:hypothetical protein K491DRAFT_264758 [Lophiostoma macrostomum CBS 122681]
MSEACLSTIAPQKDLTFHLVTMVRFSQRLLSFLFSSSIVAASSCKCTPESSWWPSPAEWSALNATLSGALIQSIPPASVCYPSEPNYNEAECGYVRSQWSNSTFHAENPISIDYPTRIHNPCSPIWPNGTSVTGDPNAGGKGCSLGALPPYVVNATTAEQVSETVKWAGERDIRVIVKNTGHSYSARSTGYGSLSIWTHHLRGIEYIESFQPTSCPANGTFKAARIAAGETGIAVNTELAKNNAIIVTGGNPDVGIMGWLPGGGHGYLSSEYGMGADNLLEATVVTPDGSILLTNPCQNADLFYAVRGGGAGTFGVMLSAVVQAFETPQTTKHNFAVQALSPNITDEFYDLAGYLSAELARLKAGGMQGYYFIVGPPVQPALTFAWTFYLYNKPDGTVDSLMAPIEAKTKEQPALFAYVSNSTTAATYMDIYSHSVNEDVAGSGTAYGSWLMSSESMADADVNAKMLKEIGPHGNASNGIVFNPLLLGSLIARSLPPTYSPSTLSLNPAWRRTLSHLIPVEGWLDGMQQSVIDDVYRDITHKRIAPLRKLSPDTGAYFNEADYHQPDWQWAFFGEGYERLRSIKKKYDARNVFWCWQCVGSEALVQQGDGRLCSAA